MSKDAITDNPYLKKSPEKDAYVKKVDRTSGVVDRSASHAEMLKQSATPEYLYSRQMATENSSIVSSPNMVTQSQLSSEFDWNTYADSNREFNQAQTQKVVDAWQDYGERQKGLHVEGSRQQIKAELLADSKKVDSFIVDSQSNTMASMTDATKARLQAEGLTEVSSHIKGTENLHSLTGDVKDKITEGVKSKVKAVPSTEVEIKVCA